jgi:hypothetical protein
MFGPLGRVPIGSEADASQSEESDRGWPARGWHAAAAIVFLVALATRVQPEFSSSLDRDVIARVYPNSTAPEVAQRKQSPMAAKRIDVPCGSGGRMETAHPRRDLIQMD